MPFTLFKSKPFKDIKPVETIECNRDKLWKEYKEFLKVEESEELQRYLKLEKWINSNEFKKKKAEIQALKFKTSDEYSELKEYQKLKRSSKIKKYLKVEGSRELMRFDALKSSALIDEFKKLKVFVDSNKFEKVEANEKQYRYKQLTAGDDIKFFLKFEKTSLYKNYLNVKDSLDLKRYMVLEKVTKTKEFVERRAFLEDKKRWFKTKEYAQEQEFLKMKAQPEFKNYFKHKGTTNFDKFKEWEVAFEDNFSSSKLDSEKWSNVGLVAEKTLGDNYSLPGDLHVLTGGKNVQTGGKLTVSVKKEKAKGKVWQMPAGFVPAEFDYTSDLVTTGKSFWLDDGIVEAKIKFNPLKEVVSSLYLCGENNTTRINLLEMGTQNNVGVLTLNGSGKIKNEGFDISKLKKGQSYIFTLKKTGSLLKWKINDTEVFSLQNPSLNFPLHINASSMVIYDLPGANKPVNFEINWVRCYRKRFKRA
ncbi:hypothetical protein N9164_08210 [Draconibacterium sp.]|nr:hypothetical protein [Draconibacterium sp.]